MFTWVVPPFASQELDAGPRLLGRVLLVNAATVVIAQLPVARLAEGRPRTVVMAIGSATFTCACVVAVAGEWVDAAVALLAAAVVTGIGECLHTTVLTPLVAELAPPGLLGRSMATIGLSFWLGPALAPTLGSQLLAACRRWRCCCPPRSHWPRRSLRSPSDCRRRRASPRGRRLKRAIDRGYRAAARRRAQRPA